MFSPEKSDIFSFGISYLRLILLLSEENLYSLNDNNGNIKIKYINNIYFL